MTFRQEIKYTIQPNAQANYGGLGNPAIQQKRHASQSYMLR
jgi:hypothetical protein